MIPSSSKTSLTGSLNTKMINLRNLFIALPAVLLLGCSAPTIVQNNLATNSWIYINDGTAKEREELANSECKKVYYNFIAKSSNQLSFKCQLSDQPKTTSLQLKQTQSRAFKASQSEVFNAIKNHYAEKGVSCFLNPASQEGRCQSYVMRTDLELSEAKQGTIVRLRIMTGVPVPQQITTPRDYAEIFKGVADQLFIEAIPLQIIEMR